MPCSTGASPIGGFTTNFHPPILVGSRNLIAGVRIVWAAIEAAFSVAAIVACGVVVLGCCRRGGLSHCWDNNGGGLSVWLDVVGVATILSLVSFGFSAIGPDAGT